MTKPASVFDSMGVSTNGLGMEYVSIFEYDPSISINFLPTLRLSHLRIITKSEPILNTTSPDTTPPAVEKACVCIYNSWLQHLDLTTDPPHF